MKFLNFDRVLCLAPHPDDVEYSMAGTILKNRDTFFDIVCLSEGGDCDATTGLARHQEVTNAWAATQSKNVGLHFTKQKFIRDLSEEYWVQYLERNFTSKHRYDCVITPSNYDSHFEHRLVYNLGYPLTRIHSISLIEYYSPSTLENWIPNVFVELQGVYEIKVKLLKQFVSQQNRSYFDEDTIKGFHTNFRCSKRGMTLVEQFYCKQLFLK